MEHAFVHPVEGVAGGVIGQPVGEQAHLRHFLRSGGLCGGKGHDVLALEGVQQPFGPQGQAAQTAQPGGGKRFRFRIKGIEQASLGTAAVEEKYLPLRENRRIGKPQLLGFILRQGVQGKELWPLQGIDAVAGGIQH